MMRLMWFFMVLACGAIGILGSSLSIAEWQVRDAYNKIHQGYTDNTARWQEALAILEHNIQRYSSLSRHRFVLARAYLKLAANPEISESEETQFIEIAIQHLRTLCLWEPTGTGWAYLAQAKTAKGEVDKETVKAIENALTFTPWEPGVQLTIVLLNGQIWHALPTHLKKKVAETTESALEMNEKWVMETAILNGWEERILPILNTQQKVSLLQMQEEIEEQDAVKEQVVDN